MADPNRRSTRSSRPPLPARRPQHGNTGGGRRRGRLRPSMLLGVVGLGAAFLLTTAAVLGNFGGLPAGPRGSATAPPAASASPSVASRRPLAAPTIDGERVRFTQQRTVTLEGRLPDEAVGKSGYGVRLYVNDEPADTQRVSRGRRFTFKEVEIGGGWTELSVSLVRGRAESARSATVRVLLDRKPPPIALDEPADGELVAAARVTVRGVTQSRSRVEVKNGLTGRVVSRPARGGRFAIPVGLAIGINVLWIRVIDPAGNGSGTSITVERGRSDLKAELNLSKRKLSLAGLPDTITLSLKIPDPNGQPVTGARAIFSISPPGLPTSTYSATTVDGVATWREVPIPREGAIAGKGFATVRVTLPGGATARATVSFEVR